MKIGRLLKGAEVSAITVSTSYGLYRAQPPSIDIFKTNDNKQLQKQTQHHGEKERSVVLKRKLWRLPEPLCRENVETLSRRTGGIVNKGARRLSITSDVSGSPSYGG